MKKYKLNITVLSDEELSPNDITKALDALNANFIDINKMTAKPATQSECKNFGRKILDKSKSAKGFVYEQKDFSKRKKFGNIFRRKISWY